MSGRHGIDPGRAIDEATRAIEKARTQARIDALREAAGWVAAFDQDQTDWAVTFDRETVRALAKGLRTVAESAEKRAHEGCSCGAPEKHRLEGLRP